MTISADIRDRVIQMRQQKKSRNQIVHELSLSGIKISTGSISNIISALEKRQSFENNRNHITTINSFSPEKAALAKEVDFDNVAYPDPYPNPNIEPAAIINQDVTQQNDTTEEESSKANQSINTLSGAENQSGSDLEPLLIPDWNPDDSHETIFWRRIMVEKQLRQQELLVIKRERQMLEVERRQLAQLKEQSINGDWQSVVVDSQGDNYAGY